MKNPNWHVLPVDDIKEHIEETFCECNPKLQWQKESNSWLIVHRSYDRRENDEEDALTKDIIN